MSNCLVATEGRFPQVFVRWQAAEMSVIAHTFSKGARIALTAHAVPSLGGAMTLNVMLAKPTYFYLKNPFFPRTCGIARANPMDR